MNRKQFLEARARADFEKTHGVTKCPPEFGNAEPPIRLRRRAGSGLTRAVTVHPRDESGEPQPSRGRRKDAMEHIADRITVKGQGGSFGADTQTQRAKQGLRE